MLATYFRHQVFFRFFSQVATDFTFILETSVPLLLLNCLHSNAKFKVIVEIMEHKLEEAFF